MASLSDILKKYLFCIFIQKCRFIERLENEPNQDRRKSVSFFFFSPPKGLEREDHSEECSLKTLHLFGTQGEVHFASIKFCICPLHLIGSYDC